MSARVHFRGWTPLRPIGFGEALSRLQPMVGQEVHLLINIPGYFFDCNFTTRLQCVQSLGGHEGPVLIVFDASHGIALDPDEASAFLAGSPRRGGQWLEFHVRDRARLAIEPLEGVPPIPS